MGSADMTKGRELWGPTQRSPVGGHKIAGKLRAVLIGVDRYDYLDNKDLEVAASDARIMFSTLAEARKETAQLALLATERKQDRPQPETSPTKANLTAALTRVAGDAAENDTVLVFFAGHGCLIDRSIHLVPQDGRGADLESLFSMAEIGAIFQRCRSKNRLLMLDCCQVVKHGSTRKPETGGVLGARGHAYQWQSGLDFSAKCVDALTDQASGWTILTSCSPGERSHERPVDETNPKNLLIDTAEDHGIFTHFLADGLSGYADLDEDGVVSFAELVQYVAIKVPLRAEGAQHPVVIWQGNSSMPLVPVPQPLEGLSLKLVVTWFGAVFGRWSIQAMPRIDFMRFGTGLLYGATVTAELLILGQPDPAESWWITAATIGAATWLVWLVICALGRAASRHRYHRGGYYMGVCLVLWTLLLLLLPFLVGGPFTPGRLQGYLTDVILITGVVGILGVNTITMLLALADLMRRGEDRLVRHTLERLEHRLINARIESSIATVPLHPKLLIWLFAVGTNIFLLLYSLVLVVMPFLGSPIEDQALLLIRNAVVILLILWQVFVFAACYVHIKNRHP